MKKLMLIAAACVALASCVKNEVEPIRIDDAPIGFQAVQALESTRAAFEGTSFVASAYLMNGDVATFWDNTTAANKQQYFKNEKVTESAGKWTTATPYYWPKQGSLSFYAYTPESVAAGDWDANLNYVFNAYDAKTQNVDFMVADIAKDLKANDVPAVFRHKLTQLQVEAKKSVDDARVVTLKSVYLDNMQYIGTYTQPYNYQFGVYDDKWEQNVATTYYELLSADFPVTGTTAAPITETHNFFLPQALDAQTLYVEYTIAHNGATETVKHTLNLKDIDDASTHSIAGRVNDDKWLQNEKITITLNIGLNEQIEWAPEQIDWDTEGITINI